MCEAANISDPDQFFDNCKKFLKQKRKECDDLTNILQKHPVSPEPGEEPLPQITIHAVSQLPIDRLNELLEKTMLTSDKETMDTLLLQAEPSESASNVTSHVHNNLKEKCKELRYYGTKWIKKLVSGGSFKQELHDAIYGILVEVEKTRLDLTILDALISSTEKETRSPDRDDHMEVIGKIQIIIDENYNKNVGKMKEHAELMAFYNKKSAEKHKEPPHVPGPSTSRNPDASPEADSCPKETPKRTRQPSGSDQEKKKLLKKTKTKKPSKDDDDTIHIYVKGEELPSPISSPELSDC